MVVILCALAFATVRPSDAQYARTPTPKQSKGPRALGLLQLSHDGKARLIPIAILFNGEFYDASAYKASPVPMALESGTVYEAERTGASLGLFTVTGALQTKDSWLGVGTWEASSAKPKKKALAPSKPPDEDTDAPPILRRSGSAPQKPPEPPPQPKPETPPPAASTPPPVPAPEATAPADDDHPVLKRGVQPQFEPKEEKPSPSGTASAKKVAPTAGKTASVQVIPAISDARGPEPLPFKYDLKPDEESVFRKKMLAMASEFVLERDKTLAAEANPPAPASPKPRRQKTQIKPAQPVFENIDLRIFDLTNANEPILVLTATAHMPLTATSANNREYFVTLVARNDIYGDLHKAFLNISDTQHLDILPRMELIDAVDADGDGRGELLFRQTSDAGQAFVIYRVIGDQLYALYQGTPSGG